MILDINWSILLHPPKDYPQSKVRFSLIRENDPDDSMASTKRDIQKSRICQCK